MCGIVGSLAKTNETGIPAGRAVLSMVQALACRGTDSTGVALSGPAHRKGYLLRVKLGENDGLESSARRRKEFAWAIDPHSPLEVFVTALATEWIRSIESLGEEYLVDSLEIVKQVGLTLPELGLTLFELSVSMPFADE
jgi:hypothetical protein